MGQHSHYESMLYLLVKFHTYHGPTFPLWAWWEYVVPLCQVSHIWCANIHTMRVCVVPSCHVSHIPLVNNPNIKENWQYFKSTYHALVTVCGPILCMTCSKVIYSYSIKWFHTHHRPTFPLREYVLYLLDKFHTWLANIPSMRVCCTSICQVSHTSRANISTRRVCVVTPCQVSHTSRANIPTMRVCVETPCQVSHTSRANITTMRVCVVTPWQVSHTSRANIPTMRVSVVTPWQVSYTSWANITTMRVCVVTPWQGLWSVSLTIISKQSGNISSLSTMLSSVNTCLAS